MFEIKQSIFENKQFMFKIIFDIFSDQRCLLVVDPKDNLAFCRTPKVSSSTWLSRFHSLLSGKPPGSEEISQYTLNVWHESAHQ